MLIDKLQIEIHEARMLRDRVNEVDIVIMHPDTFNEIFASLIGPEPAQVPIQGITLRGCRVYRSEDIPKNQFIVR